MTRRASLSADRKRGRDWKARSDEVGEIGVKFDSQNLKRGCSVNTARSTCATTAHLTCRYALRVKVNTSRRSGWRRSASLTAGPCASLPENRKPTTACLVGLGEAPLVLLGSATSTVWFANVAEFSRTIACTQSTGLVTLEGVSTMTRAAARSGT